MRRLAPFAAPAASILLLLAHATACGSSPGHEVRPPEGAHAHHLDDRSAYFATLARYLRPGGRVAIVDFEPGELPVGPPDAMKIPPLQIIEEVEAAGYSVLLDDRSLLPYQFLLIFRAPAG